MNTRCCVPLAGVPAVGWRYRLCLLAVGLAVSAGCQGEIGSIRNSGGGGSGTGATGSGTGATGSGTGAATGAAGAGPGAGGSGMVTGTGGAATGTGTGGSNVALDCSKPRAPAIRARLLSSTQYTHSVQDLFQATGDPGKPLGDKNQQLTDPDVEQRADVASSVAHEAALNLSKWSPCTPPATGDATACEQQIIDKVGSRALRRPLTADEKTQMKALFDAGIKEKDFATGVEWYLTGLLQAPDFMYELVRPDPTEIAGEIRALGPYEYASRMAYFIWDSLPDDKLLTAAGANELADASKRQTHIDRMLQDPKFTRGVERYYGVWLNLGAFSELARDDAGFDLTVVQALSTSLLMSATQLYASASPNISGLFSGQSYYMNDVLRRFYGLSGTGTSFAAATMSNQNRRGILTHPALMAVLARPNESFPISRGLFVTRKLLCKDVPLPNGLTIPELAPVQEGVSTRQRIEMHASNPQCAFCHDVFDPPGFALEGFDEVGRFRTMDHGVPVNTSGALAVGSDIDGAFATGDELLARIATSNDVRGCFARQYLAFALSRPAGLVADDACSADAVGKSFAPTGDLKQLVSAVVSTDAFRMRLAEGVSP